jgi:hypothetical protein
MIVIPYQIRPPGTGNAFENSFTYSLSFMRSLSPKLAWTVSLKSFSLVPGAFLLNYLAISVALSINFMIWMKSCYLHPLVVIAGLPILIPEGIRALLSPGTVFLLIETDISLVTAYILPPSIPLLLISVTKRWLSVPPETIA